MRALTINNPYAHLIVTPQCELPNGAIQKRVENRVWQMKARGLIMIHAGKSLSWFKCGDYPVPTGKLTQPSFPEMSFGAIVGVARVADCRHIDEICAGELPDNLRWLEHHHHVSGPWCIVFDEVFRLERPVPCPGALGLWQVPDSIYEQVNTTEWIEVGFTPVRKPVVPAVGTVFEK